MQNMTRDYICWTSERNVGPLEHRDRRKQSSSARYVYNSRQLRQEVIQKNTYVAKLP
jgi:hypothetical protein